MHITALSQSSSCSQAIGCSFKGSRISYFFLLLIKFLKHADALRLLTLLSVITSVLIALNLRGHQDGSFQWVINSS